MARARSTSRALGALVAATPAGRDRFVDLLRAFSIAVVVLGHWLMAVVYMRAGELSGANALDSVEWLWALTWVLQVMPLFFFVGGFSNLVALRSLRARGGTYDEFLVGRLRRLMAPTIAFVAVWTGVSVAADVVAPSAGLDQAAAIIAKPLWFLAVYVMVVALAPAMVRLHERFGLVVPAALAGAAAVVDAVRIAGGVEAVGYLNFAFVWLFAHQLGFAYADGTLTALSRRAHAALAVTGLAVLAALVGSGIYSPSMVGMATDKASNNSPPSFCLVALTVWLVGAAMLVRAPASRWLRRPRAWAAVIAANSMIMTVFLWHLTAMLVAVLALYPLGFPQPEGGTAPWWLLRPVWLVAMAAFLVPFVVLFGRFERPSQGAGVPARGPVVAAAALLVAGLAGAATTGFAAPLRDAATLGFSPLPNAATLGAGWMLVTARGR